MNLAGVLILGLSRKCYKKERLLDVLLPCGHRQVVQSFRLRRLELSNKKLNCNLCSWNNSDSRLNVLVALVAAEKCRIKPDRFDIAKMTGIPVTTCYSAINFLIEEKYITHGLYITTRYLKPTAKGIDAVKGVIHGTDTRSFEQ